MKIKLPVVIVAAVLAAFVISKFVSRRLAPDGTFYLLEHVSIVSNSGVTGFWPGTEVRMVDDKGDTMIVSSGGQSFEVRADKLTNDMDLGELAGKRDAESQQLFAQSLIDLRRDA